MKKILIKGEIGWDINSRDIDRQLAIAKTEDITIEMATPGGSVYEGLKIYNAIKDYPGNVSIKLVGLVASMGSYIALSRGAENVIAEDNAVFMIHNPSAGAYGDYRIAKKLFDLLDGLAGHLARAYAFVSGKTVDQIRKMFDDETYMYGQEIVDQGFAASVIEGKKDGDQDKNSLLAMAKMKVDAVMEKVRAEKISSEQIESIQAMLPVASINPEPVKGAEEDEPEKKEVTTMNLEELKAKFPGLYDQVFAMGKTAGQEKGVSEERARVEKIINFIPRLPAASVNVAAESIKNGDDFATFSLNAQCAMHAGKEVQAGIEDNPAPVGQNGNQPVEPVSDGKITTADELAATSASLARIAGLTVKEV